MGEFVLTPDQNRIKEMAEKGISLFITGSGGVGKSVVVRELIDDHTVVLAPTGVAAVNIGGETCHSVFNLPIGVVVVSDYQKSVKRVNDMFGNRAIKRIIFDEIGMLRADQIDLIDHRLRTARNSSQPFGGIQIIGVGDFYQLSPIVSKDEKPIYQKKYGSAYCFHSKAWKQLNPVCMELTQVMRQEDERQVKILNSLRTKDRNYRLAIQRINEMGSGDEPDEVIALCSLKKTAYAINQYEYKALKGQEASYMASYSGDFEKRDFPTDVLLKLKIGTKVVFCANDIEDGQYRNGERGEVVTLGDTYVEVKKENGSVVMVKQFKWSKQRYVVTKTADDEEGSVEREDSGSFSQLPLLLGYAITIHKSQGMTLDGYILDLGYGAFAHGMAYVALSRAKDLTKVYMRTPLKTSDIIVDKEVQEFYNSL